MGRERWVNGTQTPTLYLATILMYLSAGVCLLTVEAYHASPLTLVLVAGQVAAGWGVANERHWGYWLAVAVTAPLALIVVWFPGVGVFNLALEVALLGLLLHRRSGYYRRVWFR